MTQFQVSLSDDAAQFVEQQVATGKFASPGEVLVDALEKARIKAAQDKLTELIREGMESGEGYEVNDEYWADFDRRLKTEIERRRSA